MEHFFDPVNVEYVSCLFVSILDGGKKDEKQLIFYKVENWYFHLYVYGELLSKISSNLQTSPLIW